MCSTSKEAGKAASLTEVGKLKKYKHLNKAYHVILVGIWLPWFIWSPSLNFIKDIGQRIMEISGEKSSTFYLVQVIGMALQRGSSACILETVTDERIYNPITAMGFSAMFTFQLEVNIAGTPLP